MSTLEEEASSREKDSAPSTGWMRQYPPLTAFALALLIAAVILPSALNLPQANPTQVLEYAPVPPDEDAPPPSSEGSISSLGLGGSSSLTTGLNPNPSLPGPGGKGLKPVVKKCVGKPPRQTEDPNAPPCVPFFEGDNGGSTWQGVTGDEITVLIYSAAFISDQNESEGGDTSAGEWTPSNAYCDLARSSSEQHECQDANTGAELSMVTAAKALSRYFNERFQTYGRTAHFWIFWSPCGGSCAPAGRRADAADNWQRLKPFAVIDKAVFGGYNDIYAEAMALRRVMIFGSFGFLGNDFYNDLAPMLWSFWPDIEHWADIFTSYMCKKVVPFPVRNAGDDKQQEQMNGRKRRFALMWTTDKSYAGLKGFKDLVAAGMSSCGADIATEVTFPTAGANIDNRSTPEYAVENVAKMQDAQVTTVVWLGGMESKTTAQADRVGWFPEWVVAGDRVIDDLLNGRAQAQRVWAHAWTMSTQLRENRFEDSPARRAFREAEPGGRQVHEYWATTLYREYFVVFKSIQVAGPYLSPDTVDAGQHAIPRQSSTTPYVAACFYDANDYSCVKDAHEAWWDSTAPDPNNEPTPGCWRMVREGKRYLAGTWEGGDDVFRNRSDSCNGIKGASYNYLA